MRSAGKVALGGLIAALSVVCMMLTTVPVTVYALPMVAGALLLPLVRETGKAAGWGAYAVVSVLVLLLVPSWEPKVLYVLFFGYYPVLKQSLDGLRQPWGWAIKLAVFNASMVLGYLLLFWLFSLPADTFVLFGVNLPLVFLAAGNLALVLYDMALVRFMRLYEYRWHKWVAKIFR